MGWTEKFQGAIGGAVDQNIRNYWPMVQELFREKVGPTLRTQLADSEKVMSASKLVYSVLPMPVRLMVKEDTFVNFCLAHRNELF